MEVKKTFYPVCPPMMVSDPEEKPCCVEPQPDPNAQKKKRSKRNRSPEAEDD